MTQPVRTPCVGICSTGIGDQVCRGCKRFAHEVVNWNAYSIEERQLIAGRLEAFLVRVVGNRFRIVDEARLRAALQHQQISFNADQDAFCWLYDLLRAGASQINDLSAYGVQPLQDMCGCTLKELREQIDQDFYTLSCAHYERYFAQPA